MWLSNEFEFLNTTDPWAAVANSDSSGEMSLFIVADKDKRPHGLLAICCTSTSTMLTLFLLPSTRAQQMPLLSCPVMVALYSFATAKPWQALEALSLSNRPTRPAVLPSKSFGLVWFCTRTGVWKCFRMRWWNHLGPFCIIKCSRPNEVDQ